MNHNSEEQKIKRWFHEARQTDAARAPSFAETIAAAQSKLPRATWQLGAWRIAFVAVVLIAIGVAAFVFFKRSTAQPDQQVARQSQPLELPPAPVGPEIPSIQPAPVIKAHIASSPARGRRPRAVRPQPEAGQSALLSFKWQSPTDFLLRTPGADLLKTVPRVGDSLIRFDVMRPDEEN